MTPTGAAPGGRARGETDDRLALPDRIPAIAPDLTGLSHPGAARAVPFLVEGERAWARGVESRPGFRVGIGGRAVASVTPSDVGTAANVLLFPGVARRDFAGRGGIRVETVLTTPTLPLVVGQWRSEGATGPGRIVVELPASAPRAGAIPTRTGSLVTVDTGEGIVAVGLVPPAERIDVEVSGDEAVRIVFTPGSSPDVALVVASGTPKVVRAALAAAAHASGHAVRAAAGPESGLMLESGIPEVDDGVAWLRGRLSGMIGRRVERASEEDALGRARAEERGLPPLPATLALGLAALGVGDRASAVRLLEGARARDAPLTGSRGILAARFASVFGDPSHASAIARRWVDEGAPDDPLTALAADLLARALDRREHPELISRLRRLTVGRGPGPARGRSRPLPMAGARASPERPGTRASAGGARSTPSEHSVAWWLARLVTGEPAAPVPHADRASVLEARAACARFRVDPDGGWGEWRRLLGHEPGRGGSDVLWDDDHGDGVSAAVRNDSGAISAPLDGSSPVDSRGVGCGSLTAELLVALAYGMLGVEADAPAGRIRIAPRIPSHLSSFGVRGIHVGACSLRVGYERDGRAHRFTLTPEAAPVPPLAVFEPAVRGEPRVVRVDGKAADLDTRSADGWTVVPVQLPVDGVRTVEIEVE